MRLQLTRSDVCARRADVCWNAWWDGGMMGGGEATKDLLARACAAREGAQRRDALAKRRVLPLCLLRSSSTRGGAGAGAGEGVRQDAPPTIHSLLQGDICRQAACTQEGERGLSRALLCCCHAHSSAAAVHGACTSSCPMGNVCSVHAT